MRTTMRTMLLTVGFGLGSHVALADDIKATTQVSAATIYTDRALVSRSGQVTLPAGAQTLVIENMPAGFDESSLRVQGKAEASVKIGAVEVKHVYLAELAAATERERAKALQAKQDEKALAEAEVKALQARADFIDRIVENGANNPTEKDGAKLDFSPEKWTQAMTTLQAGMAETQKGLVTKNIAIRTIDEEIAKLQNDVRQVQTQQRERRDVYIHVEAKADTVFEFSMTYQSPGAYWRPVYDARLDTGKAELLLEQYGQVAQQTGEDWHNVSLTLSTARPELGTEMPHINPWYIQSVQQVYAQNASIAFAGGAMRNMAAAPAAMKADARDELKEEVDAEKRKVAEMVTTQAVTTDYSAEFKVPGHVDLKSVAVPAKFFVGKTNMAAPLYVQATPRLGPQAYLFAKIVNGEKFPIIPGVAAKYRDGAFMGNAAMKLLRPGEQIGLSFGVDDRVKVEYQKTKQSADNPTLIFVGDVTVERAYRSKVKNLHETPVTITVYDQFPIAGDADIKTELLESATTKGFVKDDEDRQGVILWKTEFKPGEEKVFDMGFQVKYPKNKPTPNF